MNRNHTSVRLLRNHIYPTYQLYACMGNGGTAPEDGLHLAVLTVLQWLRERLGDDCPGELQSRGPEEYLQADGSEFRSFYLNCGFSLDVISVPEKGVWCMQLTEPDLGSNPGEQEQTRAAVPGRVIITNVSFTVTGGRLECAFQTEVSDPEGAPQAPEYRLSVVRRLAENGNFGLTHVLPLCREAGEVQSARELKELVALLKNPENQLPTVIFPCRKETPALPAVPPPGFPALKGLPPLPLEGRQPALARGEEERSPFDAQDFALHQFGYGRTFVLHTSQFAAFKEKTGVSVPEGGVLVFAPGKCGKAEFRREYAPSERMRGNDLLELTGLIRSYSTGKVFSFGGALFTAEAHLLEDELREALGAAAENLQKQHAEDREALEEQLRGEIRLKNREIQELHDRLARRDAYVEQLKREKQEALERADRLNGRIDVLEKAESETERYLVRLRTRPGSHLGIADWIADCFPERLLLHPKGKKALEDTNPDNIDLPQLMDALDYLATDLWESRFAALSEEDARDRCQRKYGRPFVIKPLSEQTARAFAEYRIKYAPGYAGKPVETLLTDHLVIGNTAGRLLRIYFLYDDKKKLIVIGRLPEHGPTLSIQA